jgi:hypothetical protein
MDTTECQSRPDRPDAPADWITGRAAAGEATIDGARHAAFGHHLGARNGAEADGIFAEWHWDGRRLVVRNDRYGLQPLFHACLPDGGIAVSPSLIRLIQLGASTALDLEALSVFFRLGYFVGEDTPFKSIRAVPPNAVFVWEDGKLTCRARYPDAPKAASLSRDDAVDRYIELFAKSIAKRPPVSPRFAVTLSGGRDSRHILLELCRQGFRPRACVSAHIYPPHPNEDFGIASVLCARLGLPHVVVAQRLSTFAAEERKNRQTHFCATAHGWYLAMVDRLGDGRFECLYDGIGGDVLSQSKLLTASLDATFHSGNLHAISNALFARDVSNLAGVDRLVKGGLRACLDPDLARRRLARELGRHLEYPNPLGSFCFWNRTRRGVALAPFSMLQGISTVYAPYLDHHLFDFLVSLPSGMLLDHRFHDDVIARAFPGFADIPYARNIAPHSDDRRQRAHFMREVARRLLLRRPSHIMKNIAPRAKMLASLMSGGHVVPWVSPLIIYLDQLEALVGESAQRTTHATQVAPVRNRAGAL